jgi:4-hydroxybenzoate polyprenyltransferase
LGWTSINSDISLAIIVFYFGAIFWTLGYDTIYGFQDIVDDEVIGLKSTSIKFKHNPKLFLSVCYFLVIICFLVSGLILNLNKFYFMGLIFLSLHLFYFQILKLDRLNFDGCLQIFKSNNTFGIITLITILLGRI